VLAARQLDHDHRAPTSSNPKLIGPEWTSMRVAQLRYDASSKRWSLFCRDRDERWWPYDDIGPSVSVDPLLAEMDADPTGIFWGGVAAAG